MNATIETDYAQSRVQHQMSPLNRLVIQEVLEVTNRIESDRLAPVASRQAGVALQPLPLLGLVTYHYAVGILPSREIERQLWTNAAFRAVCGFEIPRWQLIRHFRRLNRSVIQGCLAETLRRTHSHPRLLPFAGTDLSAQAATRIENAMLLDSDEDEQ